MQSREFPFSPNFNFSTDSVFTARHVDDGKILPPIAGNFELLDNTEFLLLGGGNFLLL